MNQLLDDLRREVERDGNLQRLEDDGDPVRAADAQRFAHERGAKEAAERERAHRRDAARWHEPAREDGDARADADGEDRLQPAKVEPRV